MLLQDDEKALLGNLQVGQAIVRLQGRGTQPFMISVPEFHIRKGLVNDGNVISHMIKLGLRAERGVSSAEIGPETYSDGANVSADVEMPEMLEQIFLDDVERYPEGGIAMRYKRLGLSVRQGQKLKDRLIEEGWVTEEIRTTPRGKVRVIRLTDQGKLSSSKCSSGEM